MIHVACAADNKYVQHAGVMMTSLFENNKKNKIHIHFFSAEFDTSNINKLQEIAKNYNQTFSFYALNDKDFQDCYISNHLTYATYYKIIIPLILKDVIDKVIYLDTDIVICNELTELWSIDISNYSIAAVNDFNLEGPQRLGFDSKYYYFNAGVILFNIKNWNNLNFTSKIFDYVRVSSNNLIFHDQDALNAILFDNRLTLNPIWNQMSFIFEISKTELTKIYTEAEIKSILSKNCIIHYTGSSKPWDLLNIHPLKNLYRKYLKLTEWKNVRPKKTFLNLVKYLLLNILGKKRYNNLFELFR